MQLDLIVVESALVNLRLTLINTGYCFTQERFVIGLGSRQLLRFNKQVRNIGKQELYVGPSTCRLDYFAL
jgi:hypothetical protein